jgi:hypothetical protein
MATDTLDNVETVLSLTLQQMQAIASKFAAQPKAIKKAVRELEVDGEESVQYSTYILRKIADDYIYSQMRDVWIQRLEMLIPRVNTSDEKLKLQTEKSIAGIAEEITDVDQRGEVLTMLKKSLLPKSTDAFNLLKCFERTDELFKSVWAK